MRNRTRSELIEEAGVLKVPIGIALQAREYGKKIFIARSYATKCHEETNHKYNGLPYSEHLQMVYDYAVKYSNLIDDLSQEVFASCWTHDLIEDCRQTYNDVKNNCGEIVAEITYALTNEKGRNRKERANDKYYEGIRQTPNATFVKLCDRLANVRYSSDHKSNMLNAYRREESYFREQLYSEKFKPIFDELSELLKPEP